MAAQLCFCLFLPPCCACERLPYRFLSVFLHAYPPSLHLHNPSCTAGRSDRTEGSSTQCVRPLKFSERAETASSCPVHGGIACLCVSGGTIREVGVTGLAGERVADKVLSSMSAVGFGIAGDQRAWRDQRKPYFTPKEKPFTRSLRRRSMCAPSFNFFSFLLLFCSISCAGDVILGHASFTYFGRSRL